MADCCGVTVPHVHCTQCARAMRQHEAVVLQRWIGDTQVEVRMARTDGLTQQGIPPFLCMPCIKAAWTEQV